MINDRLAIQRGIGLGYDHGCDYLAEAFVNCPNNRAFVNIWMLVERCFHFGGVDVFAPTDDQILFSVKCRRYVANRYSMLLLFLRAC